MNPGAQAQLLFRHSVRAGAGTDQQKTSSYALYVSIPSANFQLARNNNGQVTKLEEWPFPRPYATTDWVKLEVKMVDDEITVSTDGQMLGSVRDSTISNPGNVAINAKGDGWFKDIEYVPLDKPGSPVSPSPSLPVSKSSSPSEPAAIKLWNSADKLGNNPQVEWKEGAVHILENTGLYAKPLSRDAILRASIRMNADAKAPQIHLRHLGEVHYRLAVNATENYAVLARSDRNQETRLKQWPLPRRYRDDEWLRLELRVIGDQLTAVADGSELGTLSDTEFKEPGSAAIFATNGWFKDVEYVVLDKSAGTAPQSSPATNAVAAKADAAWKTRWHKPGKLRAAGVDRMGKLLDVKAAEAYDDIVQVAVVDPTYYNGRAWAALRSQGDVVWSDGYVEKDMIGLKRSQAGVFSIGKGGKVTLPGISAPEPVFDASCISLSVLPSKHGVIGWADEKGVWKVGSTAYDSGLIERPNVTTGAKVIRVVVANQAVGVLREDGNLRVWSEKELSLPAIIVQDVTDVLPMGELWAVLKKDGSILKFPLKKSDKDGKLVMPTEGDISSGWKAKAMASGGFSLVFQRQDGRWTTDLPGLVEDTLAKLHTENNESFSVFREGAKGGILWIEPAAN